MYLRTVGTLILLFLLGEGAGLHAQSTAGGQDPRDGIWFGFGAGAAHASIDCTPCAPLLPNDPWEGGTGFGFYLVLGGAVRPNLLLGGAVNVYGKRNNSLQRDATLGGISAVAQFYPLSTAGLYIKGGTGVGGSILAGGPGLIQSGGWLLQGGAGYDVRLGGRFALAPFANFVQLFSAGAEGRNQGVRARGPRNPRYVQIGIGAHWY